VSSEGVLIMGSGFNWLSPKAETRHSAIEGDGTFAKSEISKGDIIAVFGGRIISFSEWASLPEEVKQRSLSIAEGLEMSPMNEEALGDGDYVNHSCEPNAGIRGQILLVAIKDIPIGGEITFDYGMVLSDPNFRMGCTCRAKRCRKTITGEDWKNPELRIRYKGYFSLYIQDKIDSEGLE
jgi:hypothetical protein